MVSRFQPIGPQALSIPAATISLGSLLGPSWHTMRTPRAILILLLTHLLNSARSPDTAAAAAAAFAAAAATPGPRQTTPFRPLPPTPTCVLPPLFSRPPLASSISPSSVRCVLLALEPRFGLVLAGKFRSRGNLVGIYRVTSSHFPFLLPFLCTSGKPHV